MANNKRLTKGEFEVIRPYLERFELKNVEAIRRILVNGTKQCDIAVELNITKQVVSTMITRAWKIHLEHGDRPEGWVRIEVVLPQEYAVVVQGLENLARGGRRS